MSDPLSAGETPAAPPDPLFAFRATVIVDHIDVYKKDDVDALLATERQHHAAQTKIKDKRLNFYCNLVSQVAAIVGRGPEPASDVLADTLAMSADLAAARAQLAEKDITIDQLMRLQRQADALIARYGFGKGDADLTAARAEIAHRDEQFDKVLAGWEAERDDWRAEIARLTEESEGRKRELFKKADEARTEWIRAEAAEASLLALRSAVSDLLTGCGVQMENLDIEFMRESFRGRAEVEVTLTTDSILKTLEAALHV